MIDSKASVVASKELPNGLRYAPSGSEGGFTLETESAEARKMPKNAGRTPSRAHASVAHIIVSYDSGLAPIIAPATMHASLERLTQAWLMPRITSISPAFSKTSSSSSKKYTSPLRTTI